MNWVFLVCAEKKTAYTNFKITQYIIMCELEYHFIVPLQYTIFNTSLSGTLYIVPSCQLETVAFFSDLKDHPHVIATLPVHGQVTALNWSSGFMHHAQICIISPKFLPSSICKFCICSYFETDFKMYSKFNFIAFMHSSDLFWKGRVISAILWIKPRDESGALRVPTLWSRAVLVLMNDFINCISSKCRYHPMLWTLERESNNGI